MSGWPVDLDFGGSQFSFTPTLCDIDRDGAKEIFLTGELTFGIRGDGSFLPGWPTSEGPGASYATSSNLPGPSAADIDGDGEVDILWSLRDWSGLTWCFNGKNTDGTDIDGFPLSAPDEDSNALHTPCVLADTDQNRILEGWVAHTLGDGFDYNRVSAVDPRGTILSTTDLLPGETVIGLYFGDIDGNDSPEVFAVSWLNHEFRLNVFRPHGGQQSGYPILLDLGGGVVRAGGPPAILDLDRDGDLEILVGYLGAGRAMAHCFHHDGRSADRFPIQLVRDSAYLHCLGLGDIDGDLEPELIVTDRDSSADYRVTAYSLSAARPLPGWPYAVRSRPTGFPAVVELDGDRFQDVCFTTDTGELFALNHDGVLLQGYPHEMGAPSISGVAAGDIDGNGRTELVAATWDGFVFAWGTSGASGWADWPMRGIDARNTGVYRRPCPADLNGDREVNTQDFLVFLGRWAARDPRADWNGDGAVNTLDFLAYLAAWSDAYQGGGRCS